MTSIHTNTDSIHNEQYSSYTHHFHNSIYTKSSLFIYTMLVSHDRNLILQQHRARADTHRKAFWTMSITEPAVSPPASNPAKKFNFMLDQDKHKRRNLKELFPLIKQPKTGFHW